MEGEKKSERGSERGFADETRRIAAVAWRLSMTVCKGKGGGGGKDRGKEGREREGEMRWACESMKDEMCEEKC